MPQEKGKIDLACLAPPLKLLMNRRVIPAADSKLLKRTGKITG